MIVINNEYDRVETGDPRGKPTVQERLYEGRKKFMKKEKTVVFYKVPIECKRDRVRILVREEVPRDNKTKQKLISYHNS